MMLRIRLYCVHSTMMMMMIIVVVVIMMMMVMIETWSDIIAPDGGSRCCRFLLPVMMI